MHDPHTKEIIELLSLASDIKARLRQLESHALAEARSGAGVDLALECDRERTLGRARNHLELALEALGSPKWGLTGPIARGPLKITGFHSASIYDAINDLRERKRTDGVAPEAEAAPAPEPAPAVVGPSSAPSVWVQNRVDEIQKALSAALGDDDFFQEEEEPAPKPLGQPEFMGNTDTLSVPELVGFFQLQEKTGVLTIDARQEQFKLEYMRGELIHASSSSSPPGERLGEILVQLGHVSEEELTALLQGKSRAERLGDALRRGDQITEQALIEALEVQVQRIFHRLFDVGGCRFTFREGLEGEPKARVRYNITRLLLETARHHDEQKMAS